MYQEFFGLSASPFNNTPDPRFFLNTPDHEEALASLLYAAEERKGFALVTGEVGSGKTLLSRLLLSRMRPGTKTAVITNTRLRGAELLLAICREYQVECDETTSSAEMSHRLEKFLLQQYARDRLAVLVLDEAQNLPIESFEEIRMLGNLEADNAKLLQVLILGQPELQTTFRQPEMRQLFQRVFRTFHLRELSAEMSGRYIQHRLTVAGLPGGRLVFEPDAVQAIHDYSEGIPRLINQICDNAMLAAYTESRKLIDAGMIKEVVEQMMSLTVQPETRRPRGEFARQFIDEPHAGRASRDPRAPEGSRAGASTSAPVNDDGRLERMDALVRQMSGRLEVSERRVLEMQRFIRSIDPEIEESLPDIEAVRTNLDAVRTMRSQVADMMNEARTTTDQTRDQLRGWLDQARSSAERVQKSASETLTATEAQTSEIREQTRGLLDEIRAQAAVQRERLTELVASNPQQFAAAQRQVNELADLLKERAEESERRSQESLRRLVDDARSSADEVKTRMRELLEQAKITADRSRQQARESVEEIKRTQGGVAERARCLWDEIADQTGQQQQRLNEMLKDHRERAEISQRQIDEITIQLKTRAEECQVRGDEAVASLKQQTAGMAQQLAEMRDRCEKRGSDLVDAMDDFVTRARERIEGGNRQIVETVGSAQEQMQTARQAMDEIHRKMAADAESGRSRVDHLVSDTQDLLVRTSEQAKRLLADLTAKVTEQTLRVEQTSAAGIAEGTATLGALRDQLAEARVQADKSRAELETLVQSAANDLAGMRSAFSGELRGYQDDVARLRGSTTVIRSEIARQIEESRACLDETGTHYRRQVEELRILAAAVVSDADASLKSLCRDSSASLGAARSELAGISQALTGQVDKIRTTAGAEIGRLIASVDSSLERGSRRAQKLIEELKVAQADAEGAGEASAQCARLTAELNDLNTRVSADLEATRERLQARQDESREAGSRLAADLGGLMNRITRASEQMQARTHELLTDVDGRLAVSSETAGRLIERLTNSVEFLQSRANEAQSAHDAEVLRVQRGLSELVESNRAAVDSAQSRVDALSQQATTTADEMTRKLEAIRESAKTDVAAAGAKLREFLTETSASAENLRTEAEQVAADLLRRSVDTEQRATEIIDRADETITTLREQSKQSLAEVRGGLLQMNDRAELLQRDLVRLGSDVRDTANAGLDQVRQVASGVTAQIESMRDNAQRDADAHYRRMSTLREQVLQGAETIKTNAGHLLNQVQAGAQAVRDHSNELLAKAQAGSDKISEQASQLLGQAQSSAERFRQQAEELLKRAETTTETVRKELFSLRTDVMDDVDLVREQVSAARREMKDARDDSHETAKKAADLHAQAQRKSEELLQRSEEVAEQSRALLRMPKEILDEAHRSTSALSAMSTKIGQIIRQLAEAAMKADANRQAIDGANSTADERLGELKTHTARVGQLVTIIRQLYGAMDARVERLRSKLTHADSLCKTVPQEIEQLRSAFSGDAATRFDSLIPAAQTSSSLPSPSRAAAAHAPVGGTGSATSTKSAPVNRPRPARPAPPPGKPESTAVSQVVQRNKQLNAWLRETLEKNQSAATTRDAAAARELAATPKPKAKAS